MTVLFMGLKWVEIDLASFFFSSAASSAIDCLIQENLNLPEKCPVLARISYQILEQRHFLKKNIFVKINNSNPLLSSSTNSTTNSL